MLFESIFHDVWVVHFEFNTSDQKTGNCPIPILLEAISLRSGQKIKVPENQLSHLEEPPFPTTKDVLIVVYDASSQIGGFLAKGWSTPVKLLDLYVEFRCETNGQRDHHGSTLPGTLAYYGIDNFDVRNILFHCKMESENNRFWISSNINTEGSEINEKPDRSIVDAVAKLLHAMAPIIDLPRAMLRSAYATTVAHMQQTGIPIDTELFGRMTRLWSSIRTNLVLELDSSFGFYHGLDFKASRFRRYLDIQGIDWPLSNSGQLNLSDETFKAMSFKHPQIKALREIRRIISQMPALSITVGNDGRNRCSLGMFRSRSGRNQPSSTAFIFGQPSWIRGLIRPQEGQGLAYIDYSQQEFGIAAALSFDRQMMQAYRTSDPYLAFAKQAGAVPEHATKATHPEEREQFKTTVLAVQYCMGAASLAGRVGISLMRAQSLLELHKKIYQKFWKWSDAVVNDALFNQCLWTVFGWKLHTSNISNERSLRNFPIQANGQEVLRLTCIQLISDGIKICAPVHDAILIQAPLLELDSTIIHTQNVMRTASAKVLNGFALNTDTKIIRFPERYIDPQHVQMWNKIINQLRCLESKSVLSHSDH